MYFKNMINQYTTKCLWKPFQPSEDNAGKESCQASLGLGRAKAHSWQEPSQQIRISQEQALGHTGRNENRNY